MEDAEGNRDQGLLHLPPPPSTSTRALINEYILSHHFRKSLEESDRWKEWEGRRPSMGGGKRKGDSRREQFRYPVAFPFRSIDNYSSS